MPVDVAVVGSINHDLTVFVPRHPKPGETVLGSRHIDGPGGKGANQAVAAARLGSSVLMVGRVGGDDHGRALVTGLDRSGVDVECVGVDEDLPTGLAVITVDAHAENSIVVSPGANLGLGPSHLEPCNRGIAEARVVLAQLEVPLEFVTAAAELANGTFILNPAPARELPAALLEKVDVLIPNRVELASLAGEGVPSSIDEVEHLAAMLETGSAVIVTLGADGALVYDDGMVAHIEAPDVEAVDPTGAGDAFCGAVAHGLAAGKDLESAVRLAVRAGAFAATRPGAQASMPTAQDIDA